MDELVRDLPLNTRVLDLGSGTGSFSYGTTRAGVVAVDTAFPQHVQTSLGRVRAAAERLPFKEASFQVVVCNHSLEHVEGLETALAEIDRVLVDGGHLWAAVPDGCSLDDRLYRWISRGGGHVHQFRFRSFVDRVERGRNLRLIRFRHLYSGFVYLNPPPPERLAHFPRRARLLLGWWPPALHRRLVGLWNGLVRIGDRLLGTRLSRYGWGFTFQKRGASSAESGEPEREWENEYFNVCFGCGAGHPARSLLPLLRRGILLRKYSCPGCGIMNVFVEPPVDSR